MAKKIPITFLLLDHPPTDEEVEAWLEAMGVPEHREPSKDKPKPKPS